MLTKEQVINIAQNIHGWCPVDELEWLYDTAKSLPPESTWVEVGTFKGRSLAPVALSNPALNVICVDTFQGHPKSPTYLDCHISTWVMDHVAALSNLAFSTGCREIHMRCNTSMSIACDMIHCPSTRPNVVYLDQDWRDGLEEAVKHIARWTYAVKHGGILCGRNLGIPHAIGGLDQVPLQVLPNATNPVGSIWCWRRPL